MKKRYLIASLLLFFFGSCTEIGPEINPIGSQEPSAGEETQRKVLIEEFTGTRCVNCPAGTAEVLRLQDLYGDRLIAVALHAGLFANPYSDSVEDFRIPETNSLLNYLGAPLGYPSGVVNRKLFEGERDLQLSRSLWPAFIEQEINEAPQVSLDLDVNYDATSRDLRVDVQITPLVQLDQELLKLSVMLLEDSVIDTQLTPEGKMNDYEHRHNLRDMLTAFNGNLLPDPPLIANERIDRNYFYQLPVEWKEADCSIVAFVHLDGEIRDILQVEEVKIME